MVVGQFEESGSLGKQNKELVRGFFEVRKDNMHKPINPFMNNTMLILLTIVFLSGCATGSSHLQAVRIEKKEPPIALSKQDPAIAFHTPKW